MNKGEFGNILCTSNTVGDKQLTELGNMNRNLTPFLYIPKEANTTKATKTHSQVRPNESDTAKINFSSACIPVKNQNISGGGQIVNMG